jgi:hypothetical protein
MLPVKKNKNVLITAAAYEMLINDYQFKPSQLLAKLPTLEDRIKSPKTNRFIHIGSAAYMNLLSNGYTEEDLLLRRDGYILSPVTSKLVKVFSKTFSGLLEHYVLEDLLKLPRIQRGDNKVGIDFNNMEKVDVTKTKLIINNEIIDVSNIKINNKIVDNLISNSITPIIVYTSSIFIQTNEDIEGCVPKTCKAFHCAASIFNKGELISFYEAKEYRIHDDALSYNFYKQNPLDTKVTNMDEHFNFLLLQNERSLINTKLEEIDLLSIYSLNKNKAEIMKILNSKYKDFENKAYFQVIKYHVWFISNASIMKLNVKFTKIIEPLIDINDSDDYEKFDKIIQSKNKLIEDIKMYYKLMVEYIEEHL